MSVDFQPPAPDLPHRRRPSSVHRHSADWAGKEMGNGGVAHRPTVPVDFGGVHGGDAACVQPLCHRPGGRSRAAASPPGPEHCVNFAIDFQTLATDSGWEGRALVDAFLHGLAEPVMHELLTRDLPDDLERIIALAIRVDARLEDQRRRLPSPPRLPRSKVHRYPPSPPRGESEAMSSP